MKKSFIQFCFFLGIPIWSFSGNNPDQKLIDQNFKLPTKTTAFTENKSQFRDQHDNPNSDVLYMADFGGMKVQLRKTGFSYETYQVKPKWVDPATIPYKIQAFTDDGKIIESWPGKAEAEKKLMYHFHRIDVELEGGNLSPSVSPELNETSSERWLVGKEKPQMVDVKQYDQIRYREIYPGIDMVCYANDAQSQFKYDFVIQPGTDPSQIKLRYLGADNIILSSDGKLTIHTRFGDITEHIPACFTEDDQGHRMPVKGIHYKLDDNIVTFGNDGINDKKLIIDPSININWAGNFGGDSADFCSASVTNQAGNIFLCGTTMKLALLPEIPNDSVNVPWDGFLKKIDKAGQQLWSIYLSGFFPNDMALNIDSQLILVSDSGILAINESGDFLWINQEIEKRTAVSCDDEGNIITIGDSIVKRNSFGNVVWKVKFGGEGTTLKDLDCDAFGNIFFAGHTTDSIGIATPNTHLTSYNGTNLIGTGHYYNWELIGMPRAGDGFFAKLNASGQLEFGSYYGGYFFDEINRISVSDSGYFAISGNTNSRNGISTPGAFQDTLRHQGVYCFVVIAIGFEWDCPEDYWQYLDTCISGCFHPNPYDNHCQSTDAFFAEFTPEGNRMWGTYYGDTDSEFQTCVKINSGGDSIVFGGISTGNQVICYDWYSIPRLYIGYPPNLSTPYCYDQYSTGPFLAQFLNTGQRIWGTYFPNGNDLPDIDRVNISDIDYKNHNVIVAGTSNQNWSSESGYDITGWDAFICSFLTSDFNIDTIYDPIHLAPCMGDSTAMIAGIITSPATDIDFQWFNNDQLLSGKTDSILVFANCSIADTGKFHCQISQGGFLWWDTKKGNLVVRDKPAFIALESNQEEIDFSGVRAMADIDGDGFCDVVNYNSVTYNDSMSFVRSDSIPNLLYLEVSFPDLSNVNSPFIFTKDFYEGPSKLIRFHNGQFQPINNELIDNVNTWADFDNDGSLEGIKATIGTNIYLVEYSEDTIYERLVGTGSWNLWANCQQRMDIADYDNDGDIDVLLIGTAPYGCSWNKTTTILKNEGETFVEETLPLIDHYKDCFAQWYDADADGDLDILYSFSIYNQHPPSPGSTPLEKGLYCYVNNEGDFQLTTIDTVPISSFTSFHPKPTFIDLDNDGLLDIIHNDLLYNYSESGYVKIPSGYDLAFPGIVEDKEWWEQQNTFGGGDMDKDGDIDILGNTRLFMNYNCNSPNTPPSSPTGLLTAISYDTVTFHWQRATDLETPQMGLTYNLRVGTISGGNNIMSSLSDSTGWHKVVGMGNVYQDTSWWLHGLNEGIYYWSVQAIDNSFAGGPFSIQDTFSIVLPIAITEQPESVTTCPGDDSILLRVSCRHFFPLSYQWFKDSLALTGETDSVLFIDPSGIEENGKYYCRINNYQYTGYSDTITITITENMAFHSTLISPMPQLCLGDSITMKIRKSFAFDCEPLAYQWFRNDLAIPGKNDTLLVIPHFHYADTGYYHCRASFQNLVSNTEPLELSLGMAYHLEKHQAYSLNCIGDSLTLKAQKTGNFYCEPDSCQWFHNGEIVGGEKNTELTLYPFSDAETGQYLCVAWFDQTSVKTDQISLDLAPSYPFHLSVIEPSYLRCTGDSTSLRISKSVTFSCFPDSCQWFKNNQLIVNAKDSVLHFEPFIWADTGYYSCRIFIGDLVQYSDTLYMTFETTGFVENPDQTPFNKIPCDIDGNDDFEFIKSLSEFKEGPYTATTYYSIYNSDNFIDLDHNGSPELIARQDSVRFYNLTGSSYDSTGPVFPPAVTLRCGDLDNDGNEEFVKNETLWWEGNGLNILSWCDTGYLQTELYNFFINGITTDIIDIDNDRDLDIFLTGNDWASGPQPISRIFMNENGIFSQVSSNIPGFSGANTDWGDYDLDGDLDLLISGYTTSYPSNLKTFIFRNENGMLAETGLSFPFSGKVSWIDYDNDGRLDFLIGENLFKWENNSFRLTGIHSPEGLFFDHEKDGDLDMYAFYRRNWWEPGYNQIFFNENCNLPNVPPTAPSGLQANVAGDSVSFSWFPASDAQTPSPGLSYNMRVGTTPGGCQVISPMSNPSGFRQVVGLGNVQVNLGWWLHNLVPGTYYWSVQAIDNSFAGGPFAPEQTFEIPSSSTQFIDIPAGWSGLSSWVIPHSDEFESVVLPIQDQLTIIQNMDAFYYPSQNINTIGVWESQDAFKIKVNLGCSLPLTGFEDQNKLFSINTGWTLMPVICNVPVVLSELFSGNDVKVIKDIAGSGVYWPEYGVNTIGVFLPGKAYFVKMNNAGTITFPQNDFSGFKTSESQKEKEQTSPWGWICKTPSSHIFVIPASLADKFSDKSFVGAFTTEGICAGACSINKGQNIVLVANLDDPLTPEKEGFIDGETLNFRIWDANEGKDYLLLVEFDLNQPDHSGVFAANGISAIKKMEMLTNIQEQTLNSIGIFPNPTSDKLNILGIRLGTKIQSSMISSAGKTLFTSILNADGQIDVSQLSTGVYFLKLEDGNSVRHEKVVVE